QTTGVQADDQPNEPAAPIQEGETRVYVYTYVSAYGEEGPPSPASNVITVTPETENVNLTGMAVAPAGPYNIVAKRIYRSVTGTQDTEFFLIGEVNVAMDEFADSRA